MSALSGRTIGTRTRRPRLMVVLPLLIASGPALLPAQTPDPIPSFNSINLDSTTHSDSAKVAFRHANSPADTIGCHTTGCRASAPKQDARRPVRTGIPFGPVGLWVGGKPKPSPVAFTVSQNFASPDNVIPMITSARRSGQSLVLALPGNAPEFISGGKFVLALWEQDMDRYNTAPIRDAIATAVADGTVIASSLMDEPENKKWGGVMTKPLIDSMAAYTKRYFPTLPVGPSHGPNGYYQWRPDEHYQVVDYVRNQYNWWVTKGDVEGWRDNVLKQAQHDGVAVAFSLNILDGGQTAPRDGGWSCPSGTSAGHGTRKPACRMTASQIRDWGKALGPHGCALLMWRYDADAMEREDNQEAMRDVAATLAKAPNPGCARPQPKSP